MWKIGAGIFLGWNFGANATANVFGTGVATGAVRYRTVIWFTAGFVFIGALAEGPKCMDAVGELSRLVPADAFFCATAAGLTMLAITILAVPASTSQSVVGAIIGVGIASGTTDFSKPQNMLPT